MRPVEIAVAYRGLPLEFSFRQGSYPHSVQTASSSLAFTPLGWNFTSNLFLLPPVESPYSHPPPFKASFERWITGDTGARVQQPAVHGTGWGVCRELSLELSIPFHRIRSCKQNHHFLAPGFLQVDKRKLRLHSRSPVIRKLPETGPGGPTTHSLHIPTNHPTDLPTFVYLSAWLSGTEKRFPGPYGILGSLICYSGSRGHRFLQYSMDSVGILLVVSGFFFRVLPDALFSS